MVRGQRLLRDLLGTTDGLVEDTFVQDTGHIPEDLGLKSLCTYILLSRGGQAKGRPGFRSRNGAGAWKWYWHNFSFQGFS